VGLPQTLKQGNIGDINVCEWVLQITNMDEQKTMQIGQIQMQLHTQPSQETYSLVNVCSLPLTVSCLPGQTGGGANYTYQFDFGSGNTDRVLSGQPTDSGQFNPTLQAGKTVEVDAVFKAPANASSMTYMITPELTVD